MSWTSHTARELRDVASAAMRPDVSMVVDLAEVTFVDSAGLAMLLELAKAVQDSDGEFLLRRPPRSVDRLLEITGLSRPAVAR